MLGTEARGIRGATMPRGEAAPLRLGTDAAMLVPLHPSDGS